MSLSTEILARTLTSTSALDRASYEPECWLASLGRLKKWVFWKMAKSKNPQKWHPHNSGWTSLFFGRFDFKHFGIFLVKFWRKKNQMSEKSGAGGTLRVYSFSALCCRHPKSTDGKSGRERGIKRKSCFYKRICLPCFRNVLKSGT